MAWDPTVSPNRELQSAIRLADLAQSLTHEEYLPNSIGGMLLKVGEQFLRQEKTHAFAKQVTAHYLENLEKKDSTPENLIALIAMLKTQRFAVEKSKKEIKFLPGTIAMPDSLPISRVGPISYPEALFPLVSEVAEHSCGEMGGLTTLAEAVVVSCVETLDALIDSQQKEEIKERLESLKKNFLHSAFSLLMQKHLSLLVRENRSSITSMDNFVCFLPLEQIALQKNELAPYLNPKFEDLFSLFDFLVKSPGCMSCVVQIEGFPFSHKYIPEKLARFFEIEREGLSYQEKVIKKLPRFSLENYFDRLSQLCFHPKGWLVDLVAITATRMEMWASREPMHRKEKGSSRGHVHHVKEYASPIAGSKSLVNDSIKMTYQENPVQLLLYWFNFYTARAIKAIGSLGLPDEYNLWFSNVNIVRLEYLLDYAQSFFRGGQASSDPEFRSKQFVRALYQKCGQVCKAKELQAICTSFFGSMTQLKTNIFINCVKLFQAKNIDQFLKENLSIASSANANLVLVDWLGSQFRGVERLSEYLKALSAVQDDFITSLHHFLLSKSIPKPLAQKIVKEIIASCSTSFFSDDHEALIALKLYSRQWDLLMESPRDEREIPLGFDEELSQKLQALQQKLFPEDPVVLPSSTLSDPPEVEPLHGTKDSDAVEEIVAGIANTTLGSSAEVVEQAPEPSFTAILEPRMKKVKKEKLQREKKIPLAPATTPSPPEKEKEVKLPLYWRQYCDPRKLIELVERAGFKLVRTKGSHQIFIKKVEDGSIAFSLPYHSAEDIDPGLARKILLLILKFIVIE